MTNTILNSNSEFELSRIGLSNISFFKKKDIFIFTLTKDDDNFFLRIPRTISFKSCDEKITFFVGEKKSFPILNTFKNILFGLLKKKSVEKRVLKITGLGYKVSINRSTGILNMKLGYSHPLNILVPKTISKVRTGKTRLVIESSDKIAVGNFANQIYSYKEYDCYKGKGFSKGDEKKKLKEIKKK